MNKDMQTRGHAYRQTDRQTDRHIYCQIDKEET